MSTPLANRRPKSCWSYKFLEHAIKLADKSGDGEVDYDEFIQFVLSD